MRFTLKMDRWINFENEQNIKLSMRTSIQGIDFCNSRNGKWRIYKVREQEVISSFAN
jgi:hypothetical protein